ncbi:MAG TPA: neuraminidase-like domain-containing protein [Roseiflexaceae bacterium]|nr:neuraminidase-like domain-containing protein [Roseiflexaceae bacterium]
MNDNNPQSDTQPEEAVIDSADQNADEPTVNLIPVGGGGGTDPVPTSVLVEVSLRSPTGDLVGPISGVPLTVQAQVEVTVNNVRSSPSRVWVELNGEGRSMANNGTYWSLTTTVPAGQLQVRVVAEKDYKDGYETVTAARSASRTINVSYYPDTAAPTLSVSSPANGAALSTPALPYTLNVAGQATDPANGDQGISGLAALEWWLDSGAVQTLALSGRSSGWNIAVPVYGPGGHSLKLRVRDKAGNTSPASTLAFTLADSSAPILNITSRPGPDDVLSDTGDRVLVELRGTATDAVSAVAKLEYRADGGAAQPIALSGINWSTSVPVALPPASAGIRQAAIVLSCTDSYGNVASQTVSVRVRRSFKADDPFGQLAYLASLTEYATTMVFTAGTTLVTNEQLAQTFFQPFAELLGQPSGRISEPVAQVRLAVEILRRFLAARGGSLPPAGERLYLEAAYTTLLRWIGTSYDELRLARGADTATREALARRLGVAPAKLDELALPLDSLSETLLQRVFGLAATTASESPGERLAAATLLDSQLQHLRAGWLAQDHQSAAEALPLVDPDRVRRIDLRNPSAGDPAYDLWTARRQQLAGLYDSFAQARAGQPTALAGYQQALALGLGEGADAQLLALETRRATGESIDDALAALGLSLEAFETLLRIRRLAEAAGAAQSPQLDSAWPDVYHILVQVRKGQLRAEWRAAEQQRGVSLGPDFFVQTSEQPPAPQLFATGVDAQGQPLTDGAIDAHWRITAVPGQPAVDLPAFATRLNSGPAWLANSGTSRWISSTPNMFSELLDPGVYTYRTTVDLSGYATDGLRLTALVAVDDGLRDVRLNGTSLGLTAAGLARFSTIQISGPFREGPNTLEFVTENGGKNQAGLRVELFFPSAPRPLPLLTPWRATAQQRAVWQSTLQARVGQAQQARQALGSAVEAAEEHALPLLRDALVETIRQSVPLRGLANWLTQRLLIDVRSSGALKSSRLQQATEALQSVLFGLRAGRFTDESGGSAQPPASWRLKSVQDFDRDWRWIGEYANWRAAAQVFYYPEQLLQPHLRQSDALDKPTKAFADLLANLRTSPRLSAERARLLARSYLGQLIANQPSQGPITPAELKTQIEAGLDLTPPRQQRSDANVADWLRMHRERSAQLFGGLTNPHDASVFLKEVFLFVPLTLALRLQQSGEYLAALDWFETVYAQQLPLAERKIYRGLVLETNVPNLYQRGASWSFNPHDVARQRTNAYTRFTITALARCFLDYADAEFTRETGEALPRARALYMSALDLLDLPELLPPSGEGAPPSDPQLQALRQRAAANLSKLREGRNIAGMQRQTTDPTAGARALPPTPYYYRTLIERAKQLVGLAQHIEANYLATLEKVDSEAYTLLRAAHDLHLAGAGVELQSRRLAEAQESVGLAIQQRQRAQSQLATYEDWLKQGISQKEQQAIDSMAYAVKRYAAAGRYSIRASTVGAIGGLLGGAMSGGQAGAQLGPVGAVVGAVLGGVMGGAGPALSGQAQRAQIDAAGASARASMLQTEASFERRAQEWELQRGLASHDVAIGEQQISIARSQTAVVEQEQTIARMQQSQAEAVVSFLANKFTNIELYEWMAGVLGGVYRYFLQQAAATALLAQSQLAFERQAPVPAYIQADYWQPPSEGAAASEPDRRGLTGSARLLQDIYQVDQYAFETNRRKLQLSQTFSLARMAPLEFQRFRQTGVLPFATPMELFDRAFPGHYLRLIRQVRVSVAALIPPAQGIRASLLNSGLSRVVIGGDSFSPAVVRRAPDLVALTSPANATGLFELQTDSELLLPFEGLGVDTSWELQLPRAANPFDFDSIADVLFTVDYTALHSFDYRAEVVRRLDRRAEGDCAFSLRQDFPDQWYELLNPEQSATPLRVSFSTERADFPPNVEGLALGQVLLAFTRAGGAAFELSASLSLAAGGNAYNGEPAESIDGAISTRRGSWRALAPGISLAGPSTWTLAITGGVALEGATRTPLSTAQIQQLLREQVDDILLIVSYSGLLPEWPA